MILLEQQTSEFKVLGVGKVSQVVSSAPVLSQWHPIPVQVFDVEACATSTLSHRQHILWPKAYYFILDMETVNYSVDNSQLIHTYFILGTILLPLLQLECF